MTLIERPGFVTRANFESEAQYRKAVEAQWARIDGLLCEIEGRVRPQESSPRRPSLSLIEGGRDA